MDNSVAATQQLLLERTNEGNCKILHFTSKEFALHILICNSLHVC